MSERSIVFRAPPEGVDVVHAALASLWEERSDLEEMDCMMFETALIELTSNVIQHGSSTTTIICELEIATDESSLNAVLTDTADPARVDLKPQEMPDEFAESGRGLAFIQALVNEFSYHRADDGRNIWAITKILTPAEGPPPSVV